MREGVLLFEHPDGELSESLLGPPELAFANSPETRVKCDGDDLKVFVPLPHLLDPITDGVANVEGFDAALKELRDEAIDGGAGDTGAIVEEDHAELFLANHEHVQ